MDQKNYELWIAEAETDFKVGKILIKKKKYNIACFHFVQAAEKAVKVMLYYIKQRPIFKLLAIYEQLGNPVPSQIKNAANILDPHYINSRYPDVLPGHSPVEFYTKTLAKNVRNTTQVILNFIKKEKEVINSHANP